MADEENKTEQQDELLALSSIFTEDIFTMTQEENSLPGGSFTTILDLPQPFHIKMENSQDSSTREFPIQYLTEIMLHFELPPKYPSNDSPTFTVSCKWLKLSQIEKICQKLDEIWEENKGTVILFLWTDFLQNEILDFFEISSPLDLSCVVPSKRSNSIGKEENEATDALQAQTDQRAIQDIFGQEMLLPTLLDFNAKQVELRYNTTLFNCNVCFCEKFGKSCLKFVGCEHVYCKDCLKGYFEVQINDGNVLGLQCPEAKCESQATPGQVQEVVEDDLFKRYDRLLLQTSLDTMSDIMYCPRKSCGNAVIMDQEASLGSCAACRYVFCIFCKQTYHGVSPCRIKSDEMKVLREQYVRSEGEDRKQLERRYGRHVLKQLVEDSFTQEWLNENSKKCPHCNTYIQKIDGCNKMTCTKCRCFFCWLCGKNLCKTNPYLHFNAPGGSCFNKLFMGVVMDEWEDEEEAQPEFWY